MPWAEIATIVVLARLCEPSSELHIAEDWYRRTALEDLLGVRPELVHHTRLYQGLDQLLPHKAALEAHLKRRLGDLFRFDYDLLLYDVTSTYFEGEARANPRARRGWKEVREGLEVKLCPGPDGAETFILCRSAARQEKEAAMHERFSARIVAGLASLSRRLEGARHRVERSSVDRQIGRLLGHNSRAAGKFRVTVRPDPSRGSGLRLEWEERAEWNAWARLTEGAYVLRSNVADWSAEELWRTYVQLSEAEGAFRIQDQAPVRGPARPGAGPLARPAGAEAPEAAQALTGSP